MSVSHLPSVLFPDTPESFGPCPHLEPQDSDQALALRLQQELDREAAQAQTVDLEDGGLFFCHICHRDLTRMTPEGRTQHVNRCVPLLYLLCKPLTDAPNSFVTAN